jgi:hypothetical protein
VCLGGSAEGLQAYIDIVVRLGFIRLHTCKRSRFHESLRDHKLVCEHLNTLNEERNKYAARFATETSKYSAAIQSVQYDGHCAGLKYYIIS